MDEKDLPSQENLGLSNNPKLPPEQNNENILPKDSPFRRRLTKDGVCRREVLGQGRFAGSYIFYEPHCKTKPPVVKPRTDAQAGDWIEDDLGVIAQILERTESEESGSIIIKTCFGTDNLPKRPETYFIFERKRGNFSTFGRTAKHDTLTSFDKRIILFVLSGLDPYTAYERAGGTVKFTKDVKSKYYIRKIVTSAFNHRDAGPFLRMAIRDILNKNKLTAETWMEKLIQSIPDKVATPTHLNLMLLIGKFIPDVRKIIENVDDGGGIERLPTSGAVKQITPSAVEASYKLLVTCPSCGGSKKIIADPETDAKLINCPVCGGTGSLEVKNDRVIAGKERREGTEETQNKDDETAANSQSEPEGESTPEKGVSSTTSGNGSSQSRVKL